MSEYSSYSFSIVSKLVEQHGSKVFGIVEEQFRTRVQPKPWWLPASIWKRIVGRLLILDMFPQKFKEAGNEEHPPDSS